MEINQFLQSSTVVKTVDHLPYEFRFYNQMWACLQKLVFIPHLLHRHLRMTGHYQSTLPDLTLLSQVEQATAQQE